MTARRSGRRWVGPIFDPESDRHTKAVIFTAVGAAHLHDTDDTEDDRQVRVAGFTRPLSFATPPYIGRHRA